MPKTKQQKEAISQKITDQIQQQSAVAFVDFTGISVADINKLRQELKKAGAKMMVAKKTLLKHAFHAKNIAMDFATMKGEIAAVFALQDPIAPLKALSDFAKEHEQLQFRAGYMDGTILDATMIGELAKLPGKKTLQGQLVYVLAAPISGFANVLQGNIKGLIYALRALEEKKS